jgi:hypothetical protein
MCEAWRVTGGEWRVETEIFRVSEFALFAIHDPVLTIHDSRFRLYPSPATRHPERFTLHDVSAKMTTRVREFPRQGFE